MKTLLAVTALAVATGFAATAAAAPHAERTLVIYGDDKCPTSSGEEIVVCIRRSENERYRIPPEFRQSDPLYNRTWADRAKSLEYVGASGPQSCSPVGSGGASGCFNQIVRKARSENQQNGVKPLLPF
jgi:hypothetical protein